MGKSASAIRWIGVSASIGVLLVAVSLALVYRSVWYAGYDLSNCRGCQARLDWSKENKLVISKDQRSQFQADGVVVLPLRFTRDKLDPLFETVDNLPNTFMTDVVARFFLPHYLRYEHRIDTRSELVRDWAVHGPLGQWAAQLLNVEEVRLYNAEAIYHKGAESPTPCKRSWHRDTIAAPFDHNVPSVTFNIYFDPIGTSNHGDGLVFLKASHKTMLKQSPGLLYNQTKLKVYEPKLVVGDVLAHNPNVYHTPSGQACWKRRSLQFRYVASKYKGKQTKFEFGPNRLPHGFIPWTLAHAPGIAPHGLISGESDLAGPWYPLVYPRDSQNKEHVPLSGARPWNPLAIIQLMKQSEQSVKDSSPNPKQGAFGLDGIIVDRTQWHFSELVPGVEVPCLKHGLFCHST